LRKESGNASANTTDTRKKIGTERYHKNTQGGDKGTGKETRKQEKRKEEEERREENSIHRNAEFKKTMNFIDDRLSMCKLKRLGRRQCFEGTRGIISRVIKVLYEKRIDEFRVARKKTREGEREELQEKWRRTYKEGSREGTDTDRKCRDISTRYLSKMSYRTRKKEIKK